MGLLKRQACNNIESSGFKKTISYETSDKIVWVCLREHTESIPLGQPLKKNNKKRLNENNLKSCVLAKYFRPFSKIFHFTNSILELCMQNKLAHQPDDWETTFAYTPAHLQPCCLCLCKHRQSCVCRFRGTCPEYFVIPVHLHVLSFVLRQLSLTCATPGFIMGTITTPETVWLRPTGWQKTKWCLTALPGHQTVHTTPFTLNRKPQMKTIEIFRKLHFFF